MEDIKGVIFDVDGVLTFRGRVYPGAIEVVDALRARDIVLRFLTNSTLKSRASCAEKLRGAGFQIAAEEVVTASSATAAYLRTLHPRSCWIMLEAEGLDEFDEFVQDAENPEYIVVGDNRSRFDFEHLNQALRLLVNGAKLIAMQPELVDSSMGQIELNVGSWAGMLERASGVQATVVGKPGRYAFELTLQSMGLDRREVIMVGDQVPTDVRGAKGADLRSVLLRTGEFAAEHLTGDVNPDWTFDSIGEILTIL
jgi:HAD superfamily hydrolase (TIGR01458 family)